MSGNYDENAARDAGYAAGAVEGEYNRADQSFNNEEQQLGADFRRDESAVENAPENAARDVQQGFDNTVQGVENVPSDIGNGIKSAANWVGDKLGGAENEGRQAEQDVDRFDQGVQNSYDQGEQQGQQQGW